MLPVDCGTHADYQNFVFENLRKYYPNPDSIAKSTWDIIDRFWNLDLSFTDEFMKSKYSVYGPKPRTPSCMQRSYLLSIDFKVTSITDWVAQLKINPLYAIVSGFEFGNTPGIGTFYDFFSRLWDFPDDSLRPHIHPMKEKVKKPKEKGMKAKPVEKTTVEKPLLENTAFKLNEQPYGSLFSLYKNEFLDASIDKGLINPSSLSLAGDGTHIVTSHRERKKRICDCLEKGITDCKCDRYFSQPDCDIGWDSSRDCFYHGYDLYMLAASDSESDLPVFPLLNPASKHDSHGFLEAFFRMKSFLPDFHVNKLLLDSAHDAILDGKQRLTTIFDFIDGRYPLDTETPSVTIDDAVYELGGKYFTDLDIECQQELFRFKFTIYGFEDADDDLIEEIFFRLNNSTPLSKPQKAMPLCGVENAKFIKSILSDRFFSEICQFSALQRRKSDDMCTLLQAMMLLDNRYEGYEFSSISADEIMRYAASIKNNYSEEQKNRLYDIIDYLEKVFPEKDKMLKKINIPIVMLAADTAMGDGYDSIKNLYRVGPMYFRQCFSYFFAECYEEYNSTLKRTFPNTQYWRLETNPAIQMMPISLWYQPRNLTALTPYGRAGTNSARASIMVIMTCNLLRNVKRYLRNIISAKTFA